MAQAIASMAGLHGSSKAVLEGSSLHLSSSTRLNIVGNNNNNNNKLPATRPGFAIRAQQVSSEPETSRRAMLSVVAVGLASGSFVQAVLAEAKPIKIGPPPPPSGGLPGTDNSDEARDLDLPLKKRFFLQPLTPAEAAARAKESAKEIVAVKSFIDKKAWPSVQNDLRSRAEYLRYDLKTVLSAKPKEEKESFKSLTGKLFQDLNNLDYAAKIKSTPQAEKYYTEAVATLNDVISKLG